MSKICIIIPCYNEAFRLNSETFLRFTDKHKNVFFVFVNDGSTDDTSTILKKLTDTNSNQFLFLNSEKNTGKAGAVRKGVLAALQWRDFDFIGYFDADLSTPLEEIFWLMENFSSNNLILVFGSRKKTEENTIHRNTLRHNFGRMYAGFITSLLSLDVYDTQCGAKIFRTSAAEKIFQKKFIDRWLFDVEILSRIKKLYKNQKQEDLFKEVVLRQWIEKGDSRIRKIDLIKLPIKTIKIFFKYM